jgi:hypothetical protein
MGNRVFWSWDKETNVILTAAELPNDPRLSVLAPGKVHAVHLLQHVSTSLRRHPQQTQVVRSNVVTSEEDEEVLKKKKKKEGTPAVEGGTSSPAST